MMSYIMNVVKNATCTLCNKTATYLIQNNFHVQSFYILYNSIILSFTYVMNAIEIQFAMTYRLLDPN